METKKLTGAAKAAAAKKAAAEAAGAPTRVKGSAANTGAIENTVAAASRTASVDDAAAAPVIDEKGNSWPSWRYGPDGSSGVFNSAAEVPKGWKDHPGAFGVAAPLDL